MERHLAKVPLLFSKKGGAASEGSSPAIIWKPYGGLLFYDYLSLGALTTDAHCALGWVVELAPL